MKHISSLLFLPALAAVLSCSKTQEGVLYNPSAEDAREIHFIQESLIKEFPQDAVSGTIQLDVVRPGGASKCSVVLGVRGKDADAFSLQEEVVFPYGVTCVTVPVTVDLSSLLLGAQMSAEVYIDERSHSTSDKSVWDTHFSDKVALNVSYQVEWEELYRETADGEKVRQTGLYTYNGFYKGRDGGLEVDKAKGANIYRINDWASGVGFKFIVNEDGSCTVPAQSIGYFHSTYNQYVQVADYAEYYGDKAYYNSYPCSFDGKNTYTFNVIYFVKEGIFARGPETFVLDNSDKILPEVDIAYDGVGKTENGFAYPKLSFQMNEGTRYYKTTIIKGDVTKDENRLESIRNSLIDGKEPDSYPVNTFYADNDDVWSLTRGCYTAVALAYDSDENPVEKLETLRFTFDPNDEFGVEIVDLQWYIDENSETYSPYNSLNWYMRTNRLVKCKYMCFKTNYIDYLLENTDYTVESLLEENGTALESAVINVFNTEDGLLLHFQGLASGTSFTLMLMLENEFGDRVILTREAATLGYTVADFDRTKTIDDFIGAFKTTATVNISNGVTSTNETEQFRLDIARDGDVDVVIEGLSNTRDFTTSLKGYYDEQSHSVIIDAQNAGRYKENYVMLGYSDGLSLYWGGVSMCLGYVGDTIYMLSSPYSSYPVTNYMFMLFSSPTITSSNYLREYVASKQYSSVTMTPLTKGGCSAAPAIAEDDVTSHLILN